jgi:predicted permease
MSIFRKLLWLFQRKRKEEELQAEIQFHLEEEAEQLRAEGAGEADANYEARRGLGNVTSVGERVREAWSWSSFDRFLQDVRYAWRLQRRTPTSSIVILLSLAIGIGANAAIFSVVDALLLRPLPFPNPERLVAIWIHSPGIGILRDWPSPGQYLDIKRDNHSFQDISISRLGSWILNDLAEPRPMNVMQTSANIFRILGAKPLMGRVLNSDDDKPGSSSAVLTYGSWSRIYGSDPNILGRTMRIYDRPFTVVGVLQPQFHLNSEIMPAEGPMDQVEVFLPFGRTAKEMEARGDENYNLLAVLKPDVSVRQAQADVDLIASQIRVKDKRDRTFGMSVVSLLEQVVGDVRRVLLILLGSVTLVLLTACANVANILLTRGATREKEIAVRGALGAGSKRLVMQLLVESVFLSLTGGALGILFAWVALRVTRAMNPGNIPRLEDVSINTTVLAYTLLISFATGIAFGLAPAFRALKVDLNTSLKLGGRRAQGDGSLRWSRHNVRGLLVVAELAFCMTLLTGAGLLVRSFSAMVHVQPGFTTKNVLTMQVAAVARKYQKSDASATLYSEIETRISHLPGVIAAGEVSSLPLSGSIGWGGISVEGFSPPPGQDLQVDLRTASSDYFRTLQIPLKLGRFFNEYDRTGSQRVTIIDDKFAARFWPHGDAVGKHVWFDPKKPITIVGVVGVVKQYGLSADTKIAAYFPRQQQGGPGTFLAVRTSGDPMELGRAVREQIHAADPSAAIFQMGTMQDLLARSLAQQQFATTMLSAFAVFGLVIAAIGVYGVMSYLVTQATHEIGIRIALGARTGTVLGMVVRQGLTLTLRGLCFGFVGAIAVAQMMSSLLFGVRPLDVVTFVWVTFLLLTCATLAIVVPAQRALHINPVEALRDD